MGRAYIEFGGCVMRKFAHMAVVLALALSLGLQWVVLQSVAWVGMAVTFSRESGIREALRKTFDGEHPCRVCLVVREGSAQEDAKETKAPPQVKRLDLGVLSEALVPLTPPSISKVEPGPDLLSNLLTNPPSPPPPRPA